MENLSFPISDTSISVGLCFALTIMADGLLILTNALKVHQDRIKDLEAQIGRCADCTKEKAERKQLKEDNRALEQEIEEEREKNRKLIKQVEGLQEPIVKGEPEEDKERVPPLDDKEAEELRERVQTLEDELRNSQETNQELSDAKLHLEKDRSQLKYQLQEAQTAAQEQLKQANAVIGKLKAALQANAETIKDLKYQNENFSKKHQDATEKFEVEHDRGERLNTHLHEAESQLDQERSRGRIVTQRNQELEETIRDMEERFLLVEKYRTDYPKIYNAWRELEAKCGALKEENATLEQQAIGENRNLSDISEERRIHCEKLEAQLNEVAELVSREDWKILDQLYGRPRSEDSLPPTLTKSPAQGNSNQFRLSIPNNKKLPRGGKNRRKRGGGYAGGSNRGHDNDRHWSPTPSPTETAVDVPLRWDASERQFAPVQSPADDGWPRYPQPKRPNESADRLLQEMKRRHLGDC